MRKFMIYAAALAALQVLPSSGALAQPAPEEASAFDAAVKSAVEAYKDRRYTAAIKSFRDAYALRTEPTLIFNIAKCYERLGKIEDALAHYETYVGAPGTTTEDRADALNRIKALKQEQAARDAASRAAEPPAPKLPSPSGGDLPPVAEIKPATPVGAASPPPLPVPAAGAVALVMVVNQANDIAAVTKEQLRDIYMGRLMEWPNGTRVRPFSRPRGAPAAVVFFGPATGVNAGQYAQTWQRKQLSGAGLAPTALETPAAVIKAVATNPGGVGYLLPGEVPSKFDGVRLIELR